MTETQGTQGSQGTDDKQKPILEARGLTFAPPARYPPLLARPAPSTNEPC